MQRTDYLHWLQSWFNSKVKLPEDAILRDFFSEGWLTSLDTLTLVIDIETKLKIVLSDEALSDKRFSTMQSLAELLAEQALSNSNKKN